jgi:hypothetical protein
MTRTRSIGRDVCQVYLLYLLCSLCFEQSETRCQQGWGLGGWQLGSLGATWGFMEKVTCLPHI